MEKFVNFFKGIVVGIATLVPGVSGGTMAVILGIYDDLIHSISSFFEDWKGNTLFLMQVGLGGLLGIVLFSKLLENALNKYPAIMGFFFIGVIFGGVPVLYKKSTEGKRDIKDILFLIIGFVIVLIMSNEPTQTTALATQKGFMSIIFLFVIGIIIAIALILPGISASFMMLALGLYGVFLGAVNDRNIAFLIPIGLGIVLGTLGTARTIENLLKKQPRKTYMLILGFVLGSLIPVFLKIPAGFNVVPAILALIVGFLLIRWISKKELG
ncbi:DUF368 domain-containing protein [Clostridium tunisiense]|uniref:DUF368 domain-containing protein n=1 Tax=Clostridium tunisiense TaxID=219748 RepID=UPI0002F58061|nr:DUF368 domain-containing protein [Clostridium tunisiense]